MDIKNGKEITMSYVPPLNTYAQRQKSLLNWGFECDCQLCEMDKKDGQYTKRSRLVKDFYEYAKANECNPRMVLQKGESVLKMVRYKS